MTLVSAGADVEVVEGSAITVSGIVTGSGVTVMWTQIDGPMGSFENPTAATTTFTVPRVRYDQAITLRFTVSDGVNLPVSDDLVISVQDTSRRSESPQGIDRPDDDRRHGPTDRMLVDNREVRNYDGTNNNIDNPAWGRAFSHLQRLAPADYADGISSLAGPNRPSAREISNIIVAQDEGESIPNDVQGTDFIWQWGQWMDHDLDLTDGAEESADIIVPAGDVFFDPSGAGGEVIFFNRALFDPDTGTDVSNPREQENEITSWIDGSMIYGSDDERALALRISEDSPFLATSSGNLLPFNTSSLSNANGFVSDPTTLFLAGDVRVNEQIGLTVMHTLWVREHNRIAGGLMIRFPDTDPEVIFQSARRLVIGKLQYITYNEFLPALIGSNAIPEYAGYNPSANATIFNEFSVAAFRLGHSMLNERLLRLDASGAEIAEGHLSLRESFFTGPALLTEADSIDPILRGLATQRHQKIDAKVVSDVRNFLFGQPGLGGFDLVSLNIQRGRDHGVPSYNAMREALGLGRVETFADITSDADVAAALSTAYASVDDIDLWVGGLAEDPMVEEGSQLGELFREIMIIQWTALRDGDRFWYENDLTSEEIQNVERTTLSSVIRNNTSIDDEIQDNVFISP